MPCHRGERRGKGAATGREECLAPFYVVQLLLFKSISYSMVSCGGLVLWGFAATNGSTGRFLACHWLFKSAFCAFECCQRSRAPRWQYGLLSFEFCISGFWPTSREYALFLRAVSPLFPLTQPGQVGKLGIVTKGKDAR